MSYAILGYLMIALIVVLLLTNKATPITAFVIIGRVKIFSHFSLQALA